MKLANKVLKVLESSGFGQGVPKLGGTAANTQPKGKTSAVDNHTHSYSVDKMGNGKTSSDGGHMHSIEKFKAAVANNHSHGLQLVP